MSNEHKPFASIREFAEISGLSTHFVRKAVSQNKLPHIRSGKKFFIEVEGALRALKGGDAD